MLTVRSTYSAWKAHSLAYAYYSEYPLYALSHLFLLVHFCSQYLKGNGILLVEEDGRILIEVRANQRIVRPFYYTLGRTTLPASNESRILM